MNFLEFKKLLFEAYMEYADLEDPLEKAEMEVDIKKLLDIAEHHYTAEDTLCSPNEHKIITQLFDLYQEYQQSNDPLERAKCHVKLNELLSEGKNIL
jgi:hypothetical protein